MSQILAQRSFASGEIGPMFWAKSDQAKYKNGLRTCRNNEIFRHGGVYSRPGSAFDGEVKDSTKKVRLIKFIFSVTQAYILEFGDFYMRIHQAGSQVLEASQAILGITQANPGVLNVANHGYNTGDEVFITGIVGMTQLNVQNFKVVVVDANHFSLQYMPNPGGLVNTTSFGAYVSGGTVARVYTIATPFAYTDLPSVRVAQSADVMILVHPSYVPQQLSRLGNTNWTMTPITSFNPNVITPRACAGTKGAAGTITYTYKVTAVYPSGKESLAGTQSVGGVITAITNGNPCTITTNIAHNLVTGDTIYIDGLTSMTQLNQREYSVTVIDGTHFSLNGIDSTGYTPFSAGAHDYFAITFIRITLAATPTAAAPNVLTWTTAQLLQGGSAINALAYNVYGNVNGTWGLLGTVSGGVFTFSDVGLTPNSNFSPSNYREVFLFAGNYPSAVTWYQQRLIFACTLNAPTTVWASQTGDFFNFSVHSPAVSSDAVTYTVAGNQVNAIMHLMDIGQLVHFTNAGELSAAGDGTGALTPTGINLRQCSNNGASQLAPILIDLRALYIQAQAGYVRDLSFDFRYQGYHGDDLTYWATHLFDGFTMVDWDWQKIPNSIIWMVRSDGELVGMTYAPDQEVLGFHHHDTQGIFENVCCIPEGTETAVYVVVNRTINGQTKRYIERLSTRQIANIVDFNALDCMSLYDGRNTGATTMTMSGSVDWTYQSLLTLTASAPFFTAAMVGSQIQITGPGGVVVGCVITAFTSSTVVTAQPVVNVPANMQGVAFSSWARAVTSVAGAWQLNNMPVAIWADGYVVANPNNPNYPSFTVSSGAVSLPTWFAVVHVGLPFTCDLQTLDIDSAQDPITHKNMIITEMTGLVENTRGIWFGPDQPASDLVGQGSGLTESKLRQSENMGQPTNLLTGKLECTFAGEWNDNGRLFARQSDPIPMAFSGLMSVGEIPFQEE